MGDASKLPNRYQKKAKSVNLMSILLDYLSEEKKGSLFPEISEPLKNTTHTHPQAYLKLSLPPKKPLKYLQ